MTCISRYQETLLLVHLVGSPTQISHSLLLPSISTQPPSTVAGFRRVNSRNKLLVARLADHSLIRYVSFEDTIMPVDEQGFAADNAKQSTCVAVPTTPDHPQKVHVVRQIEGVKRQVAVVQQHPSNKLSRMALQTTTDVRVPKLAAVELDHTSVPRSSLMSVVSRFSYPSTNLSSITTDSSRP